jgi:N-acetylmuramoyl-L-alanine amidase
MKSKNQIISALILFAVILSLNGCATAPPRESFTTYNINGATYYPLIQLCAVKGIEWKYDTFTRIVNLNENGHKITLKVGDNLVLIDQRAILLNRPVDIYEGTVVVPAKFKEQVIDILFGGEKSTPKKTSCFLMSSRIKKVIVDAGHGGNDPGALGRAGLREKDVNLDIAKRLAALLRIEGVNVVMTRSTDRFIPLDTRVEITNNANADLFVSIHSNANRTRSLNGFEVYYVASSLNDSKRAISAARTATPNLEGAFFASRSLDLKAMLWDMLYTYDRAESIQLAREICKSVRNNIDVRVIGVKDARYEVLRGARMPAVLVETGFVSNSNEERMLKNGYYRQKIAESIMEGMRDYAQGLALTEGA